MKFSAAAVLALAASVHATSTVKCDGCPESSSTPDVVTRTDPPSSSCTEPPLTVIPGPGMSTSTMPSPTGGSGTMPGPGPTPTGPPVGAAGVNGVNGALVVVAAAAVFAQYLA